MTDPAVIVPGLLLGSRLAAEKREVLNLHGITYVINTSKEIPSYFENDKTTHVAYLKLQLEDSEEDDMESCFKQSSEFINSALRNDSSVLVHCQAGISRSATIVIAYLMCNKNMSLKEAYFHVKSKKTNIQPNIHFFKTLQKLERCLTGLEATFSLLEYHTDVLTEMGFDSNIAKRALERSENDFNLALSICLGGF